MEGRVSLLVQSDVASVDLVMAMVRGLCDTYLGDGHRLVEVAIGEACTNVVRHAHAGHPERPFRVDLRVNETELEVVITDEGAAYDFRGRVMPAPDIERLESIPEGGYGIPLIKAIMDVAEYRREAGTNVLRLVKRRVRHG